MIHARRWPLILWRPEPLAPFGFRASPLVGLIVALAVAFSVGAAAPPPPPPRGAPAGPPTPPPAGGGRPPPPRGRGRQKSPPPCCWARPCRWTPWYPSTRERPTDAAGGRSAWSAASGG